MLLTPTVSSQYDAGARLIEEALGSEVLTKRTIKTTEVQTLVHMVASLYAWLPPWLLHHPPTLPAPCFSLALLSCREASALVQTALTDSNKGDYCLLLLLLGFVCQFVSTISITTHIKCSPTQMRVTALPPPLSFLHLGYTCQFYAHHFS